MTLESPGMGKKATIHSEHSENIAYFRCSIRIENSHALSDTFCKPRVTALSRQWWLCCYPESRGALGAPWRLSYPHHSAHHHCLCIPAPCGLAAAAMQWLLKHPQSSICFTVANGNTILYMYTSQAKSLGYSIILTLGSGAPAEA